MTNQFAVYLTLQRIKKAAVLGAQDARGKKDDDSKRQIEELETYLRTGRTGLFKKLDNRIGKGPNLTQRDRLIRERVISGLLDTVEASAYAFCGLMRLREGRDAEAESSFAKALGLKPYLQRWINRESERILKTRIANRGDVSPRELLFRALYRARGREYTPKRATRPGSTSEYEGQVKIFEELIRQSKAEEHASENSKDTNLPDSSLHEEAD